jgi:CRISPR-associated protein Csx17
MSQHRLPLPGCAPVPLAHYLKALGILRLVAEQADPAAAGCWPRDTFVLHSSLDREALLDFFLHRYRPTPILAPWNNDGGFFKNSRRSARETLQKVEFSAAARLSPYRVAIKAARDAIAVCGITEPPSAEAKADFLTACRGHLPDDSLSWLDAAVVLTEEGAKYPPLLGSGGNDGSLDFSKNLLLRIIEVMDPVSGAQTAEAASWLRQALFAEAGASQGIKAPIGQFFPGTAGGANATSGFAAESVVNPWDYILMLEGALLFASASVKRLESGGTGVLAYPFCVRSSGVGFASAAGADEVDGKSATEEIWLPIWGNETSYPEIRALLAEGRVQVGKRAAKTGVDFTQAVVTLGVDRGISAFQRYGFLIRNGLSTFATPLGRVVVRRNARADLLSEFDEWLGRLRRAVNPTAKPLPPASVSRAVRQLEDSILNLCRHNDAARLQRVLVTLGGSERAIARSQRWAKGQDLNPPKLRIQPLACLSYRWLADADTGSREFRLAAALASLTGSFGEDWLALRCHLEPVETPRRGQFAWAANASNDVQWSEAPLPGVLNAIFARRLIRAEQAGTGSLPETAHCYATVADITAFIEGETDDTLLRDLLWGLSLIDWSADMESRPAPAVCAPPALYALLKLCFLPQRASNETIPLVPAIHHRAAAGDGATASQLAARRLRASGFPPALREIPLRGEVVQRTAAAILFPLDPREWTNLRDTVLRPAEVSRA